MSDYIAALAQLTDEEQRIYRQDWIEPADRERLAQIEVERVRLWNVERARRCGADESAIPPNGWKVDQPNGWARNVKRIVRLPIASADELARELAAYQEGATHAAD